MKIGSPEDGAIGNSDIDLAVGPDGTLYFVSMGFNRTTFEGTHIAVGVSRDIGASWTWTLLSEDRLDDRPWVAVAPDRAAHVIWNDGSGVSYAISTDYGNTWMEREKIHARGGSSTPPQQSSSGIRPLAIRPRSRGGSNRSLGIRAANMCQ